MYVVLLYQIMDSQFSVMKVAHISLGSIVAYIMAKNFRARGVQTRESHSKISSAVSGSSVVIGRSPLNNGESFQLL